MAREKVAVVVAHPDDETLWAGGTILANPGWDCLVAALCRKSDPDRSPRFARATAELGAGGAMADLEDGPEQKPLPGKLVEDAVLRLLPRVEFDLVITHGPEGEYTRHRRHEEVSRGVTGLWSDGGLCTREMWLFAYSDDGGAAPVHARPDAHRVRTLSVEQWRRKRQIIAQIYGFGPESFESRNAPRTEAFWCFGRPEAYLEWRKGREQKP